MKRIFCLLLFFPFAWANAQKDFLRVYNAKGKKINKGYLFNLSDSSLTLARKKNIISETPVSQINVVKSNRTTGHRIAVTTATIVGVVAVIIVIATGNKYETGPGFFSSGSGRKKKESVKPLPAPKPLKKYKVGGNSQTWEQQKALLGQLF